MALCYCYRMLQNVAIHCNGVYRIVVYVTAYRALATVEVPPLVAGQHIQIGWIQVCRDMTFVNSYGKEGV